MRSIWTKVKCCVILGCLGWAWAGCNVVNPPEQTPTYVHIDSFKFQDNPLVRTITLSHDITSVWVYYNNNPIGEFDLPVTFPVITDGNTAGQISLYPGIAINGLNDFPNIYPFYQPDTSLQLKAQPGKIVNYTPSTRYFTDTKITWTNSFSAGAPLGFGLVDGDKPMVPAPDSLIFEGTGSAMIVMSNPGVDSSEDSSGVIVIPTTTDAYIEFNYRSDVAFSVGLRSNLSSTIASDAFYLAGINPSNGVWKKFYLNITSFLQQYSGANYNIYIKTWLPTGQPTGKLLLDNIQLVTL